jgi:membrane protease YdiL (CAAX protease family)
VSPAGERNRRWLLAPIVGLVALVLARVAPNVDAVRDLHRWLHENGVPPLVRSLQSPLILSAGAWLGARLAAGSGHVATALGLRAPFARGVLVGAIIGLPMLLQAPFSSTAFAVDQMLVRAAVVAPFVEELFFRGLLVAIPVRIGGTRFWPTAVLMGLLFGSVHVPWNATFGSQHLPVLGATAAGGIWYAWLLRCYDWNLWVTIALHAVMNAAWGVFQVSDDAAGGLWPNVGRGLTIALGTVMAIRHRRRRHTVTA